MVSRLVWCVFSSSSTLFCCIDGRHCLQDLFTWVVLNSKFVFARLSAALLAQPSCIYRQHGPAIFVSGYLSKGCYSSVYLLTLGMALGCFIMELVFEILLIGHLKAKRSLPPNLRCSQLRLWPCNHGNNDAQKTMESTLAWLPPIFTTPLQRRIPLWVKLLRATTYGAKDWRRSYYAYRWR